MKVVYSPRYEIDIGPHVFPTVKYRLVRDRLIEAGHVRAGDIVEPQPAQWDQLALVHTPEYLAKLREGTFSPEDLAQLELPWSAEMVDGFRVMVGGTIQASQIACDLPDDDRTQPPSRRRRFPPPPGLRRGHAEVRQKSRRTKADGEPRRSSWRTTPSGGGRPLSAQSQNFSADSASSAFNVACHIGGGLHHAFPSHGEGFCPLNDVAVAIRVLQRRGIERVAIIDLDVHHGNGTAFIFESDPRVFTFSMHQQHNYPLWKPRGSLDVGLPDGAHDHTYLLALERALPTVMGTNPQCVFYLAGADPYQDDQLGGLALTRDGLRRRDRLILQTVAAAGIPLVVTLAGGYARRLEDTVAIHVATIEEADGLTRRAI